MVSPGRGASIEKKNMGYRATFECDGKVVEKEEEEEEEEEEKGEADEEEGEGKKDNQKILKKVLATGRLEEFHRRPSRKRRPRPSTFFPLFYYFFFQALTIKDPTGTAEAPR